MSVATAAAGDAAKAEGSDYQPNASSAYHSLPESGEAVGVGLSSSFNNKDVESSEMQALEQEPAENIEHNNNNNSRKKCFHLSDGQLKTIVSSLYLCVGAIFGSLLRIILAQLFGEECLNPGTVGWLAAASPLCVTANGEVGAVNGIIFADFPANMLGSFIMGFMVSSDSLGLPVSAPIGWLPPDSFFQKYDMLHLAIRTGFCGSLTTFSSWNSDMVVMMYATGVANTRSNVLRALIGYVVGMETALGSYAFGRTVALWIHRWTNPVLRQEEDAVITRKEQGVYINNKLPTLERRYLPNLDMEVEPIHPELLDLLSRWRESTREARRVGNERLAALCEIEECCLIERQPATPVMVEDAQEYNWDLPSLEEWVRIRDADKPLLIQAQMPDRWYSWKPAAFIFTICIVPLIIGLVLIDDNDRYSVTYRTMICAALFAGPGALIRWQLSAWNGILTGDLLGWIPAGTLTVNVVGSIISITTIALELRLERHMYEYQMHYGFGVMGLLRAIKVGFAGSLTTVSSFVGEVATFMRCSRQQYRAYVYILMTIGISCILSVIVYGVILFAF